MLLVTFLTARCLCLSLFTAKKKAMLLVTF
jgi:hypothetical protein